MTVTEGTLTNKWVYTGGKQSQYLQKNTTKHQVTGNFFTCHKLDLNTAVVTRGTFKLSVAIP